jgi:hypothetical protein
MANPVQLLPGFGGKAEVTQALVSSAGAAAGADVYDCSRIAQMAVQVKTWAAGNLSVQVERSFDGSHWTSVGSALTAVGGQLVLDITDGPFGLIRFTALSSDTTASVTVIVVGWELQNSR